MNKDKILNHLKQIRDLVIIAFLTEIVFVICLICGVDLK